MTKNFPEWMWHDEAEIIDALISSIFLEGLSITVYDGEGSTLFKATDRDLIQMHVAATDETTFILGEDTGFFWMVHGNRCDVISDFADNDICNRIWERVESTADYWSEQ